jgi:hypothetical protein
MPSKKFFFWIIECIACLSGKYTFSFCIVVWLCTNKSWHYFQIKSSSTIDKFSLRFSTHSIFNGIQNLLVYEIFQLSSKSDKNEIVWMELFRAFYCYCYVSHFPNVIESFFFIKLIGFTFTLTSDRLFSRSIMTMMIHAQNLSNIWDPPTFTSITHKFYFYMHGQYWLFWMPCGNGKKNCWKF